MDDNKELLTILEVSENEFNQISDVELAKLNGCQLQLGIISILGLAEDSDDVVMNVAIRVLTEGKQVLISFSISCKASILGWKEMSHKEADVRMNPAVEKLLGYCYAYLGGAMKNHVKGTKMEKFYLPVIEPKELMPHLVIQ